MADFLVRCESCGYGITASDTLELAKMNAESKRSCSKCNSRSFKIVKREKDVSISDDIEDDDDDDDDPERQSSLEDF